MKKLFLFLLGELGEIGNIIEATMYRGEKYSNIVVETAHGTYEIGIQKKDEEKKNAN